MLDIPLHLLVVHFPIALAVIAVIYDTRGRLSGRPELHQTGYVLTLWSAAGAALALATGLQLTGGHLEAPESIAHAGLGLVGGIILIALAVLRYSAEARKTELETYPVLWFVLEIAGAAAVVAAAVTGHRLEIEGR